MKRVVVACVLKNEFEHSKIASTGHVRVRPLIEVYEDLPYLLKQLGHFGIPIALAVRVNNNGADRCRLPLAPVLMMLQDEPGILVNPGDDQRIVAGLVLDQDIYVCPDLANKLILYLYPVDYIT